MNIRRSYLFTVALIFSLSLITLHCGDGSGSGSNFAKPRSAAGMNVLVVSIDTLRADRLGCYGYAEAETPTIDRLAARGARFDQATSGTPITLPSHASIFTGLDAPNHGVRHNGTFKLKPEQTTLAERFQGAGYDTSAFISAFVLDRRFGLDQGFSRYDDRFEPVIGASGSYPERNAEAVTDATLNWLSSGRTGDDRPFFTWVHYFDPHGPYTPPAPYDDRFAQNPYDGEIAFVDAQLGRIVALLERDGLLDSTLIVLTSDHGEALGEHNEATHADLIYDSTMRVPLIFSNPTIFPSESVIQDRIAATIDIAPTIAGLTGVRFADALDGVDLTGRSSADRAIYIETLAPLLDYGWAPLHGLRTVDRKYILAPSPELYDLKADPGENTNLFSDQPDAGGLRVELVSRLSQWPDPRAMTQTSAPLSEDERQKLAALGYVSGGGSSVGSLDPKAMMPIWHLVNEAQRQSVAGEHEDAITTIRKVLAADPADGKAWAAAMQIYDRAQQPGPAEVCARRSLELRPTSELWVNVARFALNRGDLRGFEAALVEAEKLDPLNGGIHIGHGHAEAMQGRFDKAREEFEKALAMDPVRSGADAREQLRRLDAIQPTP